jgi:hypothetical protein
MPKVYPRLKIYHRLYDAAKLDALSAEILNKNDLYAPAIYHCAQAVEKCLKATHAYYLMKIEKMSEYEIGKNFSSKRYGHDLLISYEGIMKSLLKLHIESEVKADNRKQELEKLQNMVKSPALDISKSIHHFDKLVDGLYEGYKQIIKGNIDDLDEDLELKKRELLDKEYIRYIIVVMRLSAILTPFEVFSRYPMKELSYQNITLLNNTKNKVAIERICVMIDDALYRVVDVWKQIDHFKSKINN